MTSTPDDGETEQHYAEQMPQETDLSHETKEISEIDVDEADRPQLHGSEDDASVNAKDTPVHPSLGANGFNSQDSADVASEDIDLVLEDRVLPEKTGSANKDDTSSVAEDTNSFRDSVLSSPASGLSPKPLVSKRGGTPSRRPFDLRFHSRLSSSSLLSPRASSPAFLTNHSRQSSLASQGFLSVSEPDDSAPPWEVIRWHRLTKTTSQAFSETARRNFGNPTCLAVSDQVIIGTSKGLILVFDHQQNHKAIIGSGSKATECGAVTALALSADHTTIAAGHSSGDLFTWEIGRASRPFLHVPPIDNNLAEARSGDGHISGSVVLHIGFLGFRRTAFVSADDRGMAFSHLASRGTGPLGRTVHTTRILGRYPEILVRNARPVKKSSVLAFQPLPLGNVEQGTDALGLVAMLTPYLLVIVSTTPIAQTQHKAARPREVTAHSAMTAALSWFPAIKMKGADSAVSNSKLVYAWSDVLTVLEIHQIPNTGGDDKDKLPEFQFLPRSMYKAEEAIVAVQWLSRSVIAALTITQQLLIIEDVTMTVTDAFDLLPKDLYHTDVYSSQLQGVIENLDETDTTLHGVVADAFHMSFRTYKGRLYLLGKENIWWGSLTNWADRLLAMMNADDFIGAIRLATNYYTGSGEKVTIGLPEDDAARSSLVREKLMEMMSASLRYAFGKNQKAATEPLDAPELLDLGAACVTACLAIDNQDFLFDEVYDWYEDNDQGTMLIDILEPYILEGKIRVMPPIALQTLINHFAQTHSLASLEEIICLLDPTAMDIDQVTNLCKQHNLYDAYIYVWNSALKDYIGPLRELLEKSVNAGQVNGHPSNDHNTIETSSILFAYMSFILTSRVYPTGSLLDDETANDAKLQIYDYLFSGNEASASVNDTSLLRDASSSFSFPRLRTILKLDTPSFMGAMNEAFEDSFLNSGADENVTVSPGGTTKNSIYNRQFLVQILLGVMSTGFDPSESIYLDMFIARNLPKYPQYMLLSGSTLHQTFMRLCQVTDDELREDTQLSVEYLLSVYQPPDPLGSIPILRKARYFRVMKSIFRQERRYGDLISTFFLDEEGQSGVFEIVYECLRSKSTLTSQQKDHIRKVVTEHAVDLTNIDVGQSAYLIDDLMPEKHSDFIDVLKDNPSYQFQYLQALFEPSQTNKVASRYVTSDSLGLYVRLMCRYDTAHVVEFIRNAKEEDLKLDFVLPAMEDSGVIDAAVILLAKQGLVRDAMNRLLKHISSLHTVLKGVLDNSAESPDVAGTDEAIEDLLESIDRYCSVGIWITQGQSKKNPRSRAGLKSPRASSTTVPLSFDEQLWLDLLLVIVGIAQDIALPTPKSQTEKTNEAQNAIRTIVQKLFTALLTGTTASRDSSRTGNDVAFLRILRAFLTAAAESSPSLSELRSVLSSIFSAYAYEESLLSLSNSMLDKDLFVHVDEIAKLRQLGWRPRGQACEICKKRVWGPGTGLQIWKAWEIREQERKDRRSSGFATPPDEIDTSRGKGKAAVNHVPTTVDEHSQIHGMEEQSRALVAFSCRHLYHRACLTQSQRLEEQDHNAEDATTDLMSFRCPSCP